jgi:hypothetical protein
MNKCPSCGHQELYGSLFCSECGAQLDVAEVASSTSTIDRDSLEQANHRLRPPPPVSEDINDKEASKPSLSMQILGTGQIFLLESGEEFTLGRISGEQPILPDVDLTPYHGYEEGVSRLHATIKISVDRVSITDLGSANGTRVNDQSIIAHDPHPLKNGDIISLGKLKAQIIIR